jgi:membrane protein
LQSSADRYGTIGVAFTYIGWLYVLAFCLLMTAILGQVVAQDEGALGRLIRGRAG